MTSDRAEIRSGFPREHIYAIATPKAGERLTAVLYPGIGWHSRRVPDDWLPGGAVAAQAGRSPGQNSAIFAGAVRK